MEMPVVRTQDQVAVLHILAVAAVALVLLVEMQSNLQVESVELVCLVPLFLH
jgi:hypothetical protein